MSDPTRALSMADPVVTANVYCSRYIDDLLREAVRPFRATMRVELADAGFLWFYRYGRRGEHLKLRIHAPESQRAMLQERLGQELTRFLDAMADAPPVERLSKIAMPPVDVEDTPDEDHPDRSMLWTTYRRSPVIIGDPLYVQDSEHVALFTRALGISADFILDEVVPGSADPAYLRRRQNAFLKLLIAGLAATDYPLETWPVYLTYHRDWLVRHLVTRSPLKMDGAAIMAEIDGQLDKSRAALPALARIMASQRAEAAEDVPAEGHLGAWRAAVGRFFEYVQGYRGRPEYDRDPYTQDHTFLPVFKLFHACANQFGFRISNEAYMHHLLLQAAQAAVEDAAAPAERQ
jgi:hypothetical protein